MSEAWLYVCGLPFLIGVIGFYLYFAYFGNSSDKGGAENGKSKAQEILARGGPKTLDEYLFLFPDACRKCGSIDVEEYEIAESAIHYDSYDQRDNVIVYLVRRCTRCNTKLSEKEKGGFDSRLDFETSLEAKGNSSIIFRVASPYLSREEAARLPNLGDNYKN